MMKLLKSILVAALLVGMGLVIGRSSVDQPGSLPKVETSQLLQRPMPALTVRQLGLPDIVRELSAKSQVDVRQNLESMSAGDAISNRRLNLDLSPGTLNQQLRQICDAWNAQGDPKIDFGETVDDPVVWIVDEDSVRMVRSVVRLYDVNSLVNRIASGLPPNDSTTAAGLFGPLTPRQEAMDIITKAIKDNVGVGTWKDEGGLDGTLSVPGNDLIMISTTPEIQRDVANFLNHFNGQLLRPTSIPSTQP